MNKGDWQKNPLHKVDILMWQVIKLMIRNKKQILERFGLTCSQFEIISAIYHFSRIKTEIIQIDLSSRTEIDPMTTSTIVRNLQKKGLVTRHRSVLNTRAIIVELTQEGLDLFEQALLQVNSWSDLIYQDVNKRYLTTQLLKLFDKLNKLNY